MIVKAKKKYIAQEIILERLNLKPREFDKIIAICDIHPYIPISKKKIGKSNGFYFKISDMETIKKSDVYKIVKQERANQEKIQKYKDTYKDYKIKNIKTAEIGYVDLIKNKYPNFSECLLDLSNTLSQLYLAKMLNIDTNTAETLKSFEDFVCSNSLINCSFMSEKGVYHQATFGNIKVIWLVPYPGTSLKDIIEVKKDVVTKSSWTNITFEEYISSDEDGLESDDESMELVTNNPNKLDSSILAHKTPLHIIHCRLVLKKLELLYKEKEIVKEKLFEQKKFYIKNKTVFDDLKLVILNCGGIVIDEPVNTDYYVSEIADELKENVKYIQPQYIFDCFNEKKLLDPAEYQIGKTLPEHKTPFVSEHHIIDKNKILGLSKTKKFHLSRLMNPFDDCVYKQN